jgi:uncharacterized protein YndB with AHSA1/START domain
MTGPVAVERQLPIAAAPVQVAAALAGSPWRDALRIEPAGSGARVVLSARIDPPGLARAVEGLVVEDMHRLRRALTTTDTDPTIDSPTTNSPTTNSPTTNIPRISDRPISDRTSTDRRAGTMSTIDLTIVIDAAPEPVWDALADFGGVSIWNPGVKESHLTSEATEGVGITRQCRLAPLGVVRERVVDWDVGRALSIEIYENDNIPGFRSALAALTLDPTGPDRTRVTCRMEYSVAGGLLGVAANTMGMRRMFTRSLSRLLAGLKYHVETGRPVDGTAGLDLGAVASG